MDYEAKSSKLLTSIGQLSESRSKKVLLGLCQDIISAEKQTTQSTTADSSSTPETSAGGVSSSHLIDLCFNQITKTMITAQPSILWKIVEYSISELDYLEKILDLYKLNAKENGRLLSSASSRLEEISSLLVYLQTLPKMNTNEYIELIGGINAHIKKITLRIKGELEQNKYSNAKKYGWIEKRCGNNQSFRTWKKMWFILSGNHELYYYIKEKTVRKSMRFSDQAAVEDSASDSSIVSNRESVSVSTGVNYTTTIYLEGELGKKKEGKGWKIRWMKLFDQSLVYYKSQKDKDPLGIINLEECQECGVYKEESNKFVVVHDMNKYFFKAHSKEELDKWVKMVNSKIKTIKEAEQSGSSQSSPGPSRKCVDLSQFSVKGLIDLTKVTSINVTDKFHNQPFCIAITTEKKNYYLNFDSNRDKVEWMNTLLLELQSIKVKSNPNTGSKTPGSSHSSGHLSSVNSSGSTTTKSASSIPILSISGSGGSISAGNSPNIIGSNRKWEFGKLTKLSPTVQNNNSTNNSNNNNITITTSNIEDQDGFELGQILPRKITMSSKLSSLANQSPSTSNKQAKELSFSPQKSSSGGSSDEREDTDDEELLMLIPENIKTELMRKSAANLLKTFKLEIYISANNLSSSSNSNNVTLSSSPGSNASIPAPQEIYTFLFSDSVLVDQVKAYAFKKIPALAGLNLAEYRLGIDEETIFEIEFLRFVYSHTMVELALKTCGIVKVGLFHYRKDRRVKEKLYPEKYQSLSSGDMQGLYNSAGSLPKPTIPSEQSPLPQISMSTSGGSLPNEVSSSSLSSLSTISTTTTNTTSLSTVTTPATSTASSTVSSLTSTPKTGGLQSSHSSPALSISAALKSEPNQLIAKFNGWNIEPVSKEFSLKPSQPKIAKQDHGKYIFECPGVVYSFLGSDPKLGPLAFSMVKDLSGDYRGLLHNKYGAKVTKAESKSIQIGNFASLSKKLKIKKIMSHLVALIDPNIDAKNLSQASVQEELQKELLSLEERQTTSGFKFGMVYCKQNQFTDDDIFSNQIGSAEWDEFLDLIGDRIELLNWPHYSAGLDVRANSTGTHSLYTEYSGNEVMFHVSTMLPYSQMDQQQIERKRQVGNDICVVIFNDGDQLYAPNTIASQFNHVIILVHHEKKENAYRVSCCSKDGVPSFKPSISDTLIKKSEIKDFLLTKLINGELASLQAPVFSNKIIRTRESLLNYYIEQFS